MQNEGPIIERPLQPAKKAAIVGASTGLGAALARRLAKAGYNLALFSRDKPRLQELAAEVADEHGVRVFSYGHDVKDTDQVSELLQQATRDLGGLDLFIYNAAIMFQQDANRYQADEDIETIQVNLLGAAAWLMPVADRFARAGTGQMVGIGSIAGARGRAALPAYAASKAGLHTYLEALRNRLSRHGVTVTTIIPGQIQTAMLDKAAQIRGPIPAHEAAELAWRAIRARRQVAYVPNRWRFVSLIVRLIPSFLFRRMNL